MGSGGKPGSGANLVGVFIALGAGIGAALGVGLGVALGSIYNARSRRE